MGGARNKPNSILNYAMFILPVEQCTGKFGLKNSGEAVY